MTTPSPLQLSTSDGARAEIYAHGAHVTSWVPASGVEQIFLSATSDFGPDASIRGGVPIIFPQFAAEGPLPKHGFARRMDWQLLEQSTSSASFQLRDTPTTQAIWPHPFQTTFTVTLATAALHLELNVTNTGDQSFTFTGALHTYLRVADICTARVHGLHGLRYIDSAAHRVVRLEEPEEITFTSEVDRIYLNPPARITLVELGRSLQVDSSGFPDVVVWNPWAKLAAAMPDLEPAGYLHMLCIEAALVSAPVTLRPDETWSGSQRLTA